jgi:DNA-binding HxlR family transcriptional regulator
MGDEYSLTPLGREFIEPMEMLYEWGRAHAAALDRLGQRPRSKRRRHMASGDDQQSI